MAHINRSIARYDITAVYTHPKAKIDIILLHGLNGHPQKTWTASNKTYWPTDLLPKTLQQAGVDANVYVWGYNADVTSKDKHAPSQNFLHHHAQNLISFLSSYRRDNDRLTVPIIWVAHSLGGLVLKSALSHSDRCREQNLEEFRSIFVSTYGIVFLGTPHEGSGLAKYGEMIQNIAELTISKRFFESQPILLKTLRNDSETLDNINFEFVHIMQKFETCLVYEEATTKIGPITRRIIVDQKSAAPTFWANAQKFGIEANHSDMCKFADFDSPGYRSFSSCILDWSRRAPDFIEARWVTEEQNRLLQAKSAIRELATTIDPPGISALQKDSASPSQHRAPPSPIPTSRMPASSDHLSLQSWTSGLQSLKDSAFFYHPEIFRPNSYSVGRDGLLMIELHRMLQESERRKLGTSAVLVRGRSGVGKTHVVRSYVFEHKDDYSGGVFWLHAYSLSELTLELPRLWQLISKDQKHEGSLEDMMTKIRAWFNSRQNWLLVLDGIMTGEGVERFIPDAPNTFLIYTSTSPAFTGNHLYDNPKLLEIPPLSMEDAQHLLLQEMDHETPWTPEVLKQAGDVVRRLEFLPLMVHVLGQQLKETREPLSGFIKRYKAKPSIRRKIDHFDFSLERLEERGASAALNVVYLLAFWDKLLPVEMLALGLRALALPWKTGEAGSHGRPSLNNTLGVLIAFALVERSDNHEISPVSSRTSKKSVELTAPIMDTLKFYPVIQRYIVEHMERESHDKGKMYVYWLQTAIDVFCRSLREADARIRESSKVGLPVDYQRYRVHGRKIMEHIARYEPHATELTAGRKVLEQRLAYVDERFEELESVMNDSDSGSTHRFSVFDRANSLSESDSGTLSSKTNSQEAITPPHTEFAQQYLSRVRDRFPPHDLPYPVEDEDSADENGGVTPRPEYMIQHKKNRSLRSPAEVSVSHDHAAVSSFQATGQKSKRRSVSASSDAETSLLKVRQISSTTTSRGGGNVFQTGRSVSSGSRSTATDLFRPTQGHYASLTPAGLTPSEERSAAEFYMSAVTPTVRSTTFVDKVKENWNWVRRRRGSSANSTTKLALEAPSSAKSSPGVSQAAAMPGFPALVDRSVSSSPGQGVAAFLPPETRSATALRLTLPLGLHQQYTEPYQPSLPRVDSSSLDPMAMSFPSPQQASYRGGTYGPPGLIDSTPMSRGSSRQSSNASRGRASGDYSRGRGTSIPRGSADYSHRAASPLSGHMDSTFQNRDMMWDGQDTTLSTTLSSDMTETTSQYDLRQSMGPPDLSLRPRRGSKTSAMVSAAGGAVGMYDTYAYGHARTSSQAGSAQQFRSRQSSNASSVGQQAAVMPPMPSPSESSTSASRQTPYRRAINVVQQRGSGVGRGRTQSESPSAEFRMLAPGFPFSQGHSEPASEPMSRGGSGGMVVGSGSEQTLVPFGDTTAQNLHDASSRLRQQRIDRQQPPGIPPRRGSASSSRGSYRNQISPPKMSRGNSGGAGPGLGIMPGGKMEEK